MLQHGRFPISSRKTLKESRSHSICVLTSEDLRELDFYKFGGIASVANASWALLLRNYIRSNYVSFDLLASEEAADEKILHYRLSENERLDEIRKVDSGDVTGIQCSLIDINTAIEYFTETICLRNARSDVQEKRRARDLKEACSYLSPLTP